EQPDQVSWLLDGIPGAYVIACGDIWPGGDSPRGAEHLRVGALDPDAALELLKRQGDPDAGADAPARSEEKSGAGISRTRVRRWLGRAVGDPGPRPAAPPPVNTVARRVEAASEQDRRQLAGHLGLPRVAVDLGRWLAANPEINLTDLLGKLGKDPEGDLLYILRQQLDGTSPGARRLLRLLAEAPVAELTEAAVARLAGVAPERAGEYLAELTGRSLVSRPRLGKCRITPQARQLALGPALTDPPGRDAVARSRVRLAAYYGRLAAVHAGDLGEAAAREWLSAEDAALLQLLRDPEPPRRAAAYLWRIADVLDAWFAREQRSEDRRTAATAMARAAAALDDRPARVTACLRLAALARESGDFAGAASHLDQADGLAGRRAALRLQVNAAWAAHLLVRGDLARAGDYLLLCRQARPRRDLRGRIADLVNQAALQLRRGEPEAADGTLGQAQSLAARAGDVGGDAHVSELAGIVAALTGHPQRAEREWERARTLYEQAGDVSGRARCLQHHGTLLSAAPGGPWDTAVAADMLTRSLELRGEDPAGLGPALAHLYLAEADQYLAEADPDLAGGDRRSPDADLTAGDPRSTDADRRSAGGGRRSAGTGQRSADGGKRSAGEGLAGDGRRAHRAAGLRALRPWPHQGSEPPEVMAVRKRLESA
ncbi:MAG: hypothetical protein J2P26_11850, partial [Nocardiopsaceae bacterium]|nr:hypothetical protein [Nocardiopsaceae bacterium]